MSDVSYISETESEVEEVPQSGVNYFWFIAFEWNVREEKPFQIFVREYFGDEDIPDSWFTGVLSEDHWVIKLNLKAVASNSYYSIFAKVEKGKKSKITLDKGKETKKRMN